MMNKLKILFLAIVAITGLNSCNNDDDVVDTTIIGRTIDLYNVNLDANGEIFVDFQDYGIEVFESDAILVYKSDEAEPNPSGDVNIWKLMPQTTYFNDGGEVVHNYDHTFFDVRIFIQSNFDLNELSVADYNSLTQNQYFRIVTVPSDFANDPNTNLETYQSLMNEMQDHGMQIENLE